MTGEILNSVLSAIKFAEFRHRGQYRATKENDQSVPYINHCLRVGLLVSQFKLSHKIDALVTAAILHDTIEDTDTTYEEIFNLFGEQVASLVEELTNDKKERELYFKNNKTDYLCFKLKNMSSWALVIKLCDRLDNVSDLSDLPEKRASKYVESTKTILEYIKVNRKLSNTHLKLISLIEEKLIQFNKEI